MDFGKARFLEHGSMVNQISRSTAPVLWTGTHLPLPQPVPPPPVPPPPTPPPAGSAKAAASPPLFAGRPICSPSPEIGHGRHLQAASRSTPSPASAHRRRLLPPASENTTAGQPLVSSIFIDQRSPARPSPSSLQALAAHDSPPTPVGPPFSLSEKPEPSAVARRFCRPPPPSPSSPDSPMPAALLPPLNRPLLPFKATGRCTARAATRATVHLHHLRRPNHRNRRPRSSSFPLPCRSPRSCPTPMHPPLPMPSLPSEPSLVPTIGLQDAKARCLRCVHSSRTAGSMDQGKPCGNG